MRTIFTLGDREPGMGGSVDQNLRILARIAVKKKMMNPQANQCQVQDEHTVLCIEADICLRRGNPVLGDQFQLPVGDQDMEW